MGNGGVDIMAGGGRMENLFFLKRLQLLERMENF